MNAPRPKGLVFAGVLALLSACVQTEPTRYYTLSSEAEPLIQASDLAIGVGPVTLPLYLDRPQIVLRRDPNRVELSEFDAWIEPLESMVPRLLAADLIRLLGTDEVVSLPQRQPIPLDYQVEVEVQRFDAETAGRAVLDARWVLTRGGEVIRSRLSEIAETFDPAGGADAMAAALSRALGTFAHEIALAILGRDRPPSRTPPPGEPRPPA